MGRTPRLDADLVGEMIDGLAVIRREFEVPTGFPPEVVEAAALAAARVPSEATGHADLTHVPFITLDPESATDLDQAFWIDDEGDTLVLRYAIADVPFFVEPGGVIEAEAWRRGLTFYLPDAKAALYPPSLAEAAASLLPDGPRPAIVFDIAVNRDGDAVMRSCGRAVIHSRAKLAYDSVADHQLPPSFKDFAARIAAAEARRGASRVELPEQEVERDASAPGGFRLSMRPRLASEEANAAMSLSANMAVADAMHQAKVGLFRVMAEADEGDVRMLRHVARGMRVDWPAAESLDDLERRLQPDNPAHAALSLSIRRAGGGASYAAFTPDAPAWHAAMAATYSHTTAPLRRLCDRYVLEAALAISAGEPVPDRVLAAFAKLPETMREAEQRTSQVERAVNDLVEAVLLAGRVGDVFEAVVIDTDRHGAKIQLLDEPVLTRVDANRVVPGDNIRVRLDEVSFDKRMLRFSRTG